jgi:hypothetical protein
MQRRAFSRDCPQIQVDSLSQALDDGAPAVVFTHIPYLRDPYPPRARELPEAWDITPMLRAEWEMTACKSNLIGIFAGHFHDSESGIYGARGRQSLQLKECIAFPPLYSSNRRFILFYKCNKDCQNKKNGKSGGADSKSRFPGPANNI